MKVVEFGLQGYHNHGDDDREYILIPPLWKKNWWDEFFTTKGACLVNDKLPCNVWNLPYELPVVTAPPSPETLANSLVEGLQTSGGLSVTAVSIPKYEEHTGFYKRGTFKAHIHVGKVVIFRHSSSPFYRVGIVRIVYSGELLDVALVSHVKGGRKESQVQERTKCH